MDRADNAIFQSVALIKHEERLQGEVLDEISMLRDANQNSVSKIVDDAPPPPGRPAMPSAPPTPLGASNARLAFLDFLSAEGQSACDKALSAPHPVSARSDLVREGEGVGCLYIIQEGWAYRYKMTQDGGRQITAIFTPGDICNLDTLYFAETNYGVCMPQSGVVRSLSREHALALPQRYSGFARAFAWLMAVEKAVLDQWMLRLGRYDAIERLSHLLCELAVHSRCLAAKGQCRFVLPFTQQELADILGLTPVHINRTLQHLRCDGLIASEGSEVAILDIERLRRIGEFDPVYLHGQTDNSDLTEVHAITELKRPLLRPRFGSRVSHHGN